MVIHETAVSRAMCELFARSLLFDGPTTLIGLAALAGFIRVNGIELPLGVFVIAFSLVIAFSTLRFALLFAILRWKR